MDLEERKRSIRKLVFASSALSRALLAGDFRSSFKGRGMDFDGLREYGAEDDALRIDWNASSRLGRPYVKTYRDDRNLSVYIIIDESASMDYGEGGTKAERAAVAASLVAYACSLNGVRVGALFFGGDSLEHREPASGGRAAMTLMERIAEGRKGEGRGSELGAALEAAASYLKRRSLVLVISDFDMEAYALPLAVLARRHDLAALLVRDRKGRLTGLPPFCVRAVDAESGRSALAFGSSRSYRAVLERAAKTQRLAWLAAVAAARVPYVELGPDTDIAHALIEFFSKARRRA
jgi:uncharacterized protein (DUF58 family)